MKLILIICLLLPFFAYSNPDKSLKVFGRVHSVGNSLTLIRSSEGDAIASMLEDPNLNEVIANLRHGDEVLVQGYISYLSSSIEDEMRPVFIIQSLRPISLSRLGEEDQHKVYDRPRYYPTTQKTYSPMAIPVTTEVASTITMTGSVLLLQSLTATPGDPAIRQQLNSGLVLFAGLMATGFFIYEQIMESNNKGENHE